MNIQWRKIAEYAIVALIVVKVFEAGIFLKLRRDARLYGSHVQFPAPSGYLIDGTFMAPRKAPCFVLRVSSDYCPYCKQDQTEYTQLLRQSKKSGCQDVLVAPRIGQMMPEVNGARQLQYVDMRFGLALNPFMTPETILFDSDARVQWYQEGAMDKDSLSGALHALKKVH